MPGRVLTEQEFNQVRDQVLASAPPNMDEATFTKWVGPQMAAAIQQAELQGPTPQGSALGRFAGGAAEMLNPITMAKGAYQAIRHPYDTGSAIVGAMGDQWAQGLDLAKQGRVVEGVGHMAAGSIPMFGPTAANIGEEIAGGDVAGGLGAGAGLLAPFGIKPVMNAARVVMPKGLRATIAESLEAKAGANYAETIAPQVGPNKTRFGNQAAKVGPELAKNPELGAFSREGLHAKVQQALESATQQLDDAADASLATQSIDTQALLDALQTARQKLVAEAIDADLPTPERRIVSPGDGQQFAVRKQGTPLGKDVEPAPNAARIGAIDQVIKEVEQLGPLARYESLRRIRQAWDAVAKPIYSPAVTADYLKVKGNALGAADATAALREHLAQASPEMAKANQSYSLYRTADDILKATQEVERTRPKVGRAIMARLIGSSAGQGAAGLPGAAAGWVLGPVIDSIAASAPTMKLQTAQLMTKLARAIRAGNMEQVDGLIGKLRRLAPSGAVSVGKQTASVAAARAGDIQQEAATR